MTKRQLLDHPFLVYMISRPQLWPSTSMSKLKDEIYQLPLGTELDVHLTVNGVELDFDDVVEKFFGQFNELVVRAAAQVVREYFSKHMREVAGSIHAAEQSARELQGKLEDMVRRVMKEDR